MSLCRRVNFMARKKKQPPHHHTLLFKKILSSFFAKESMMQIGMNPASMFVSFVSSKQFFWLVNRRMTEHYKLNLYDINLDSFDVRIGFGDDPTITMKNIDIYYAYNSSANFVGYKSYNPNIVATGLAMLYAAQTVDLFDEIDEIYFKHFVYTIYFLVFVIIAKIKKMPETDEQWQYDWLVSLFWAFYETMFDNTDTTLDHIIFADIKRIMVDDVKTMFSLFRIYQTLNQYFVIDQGGDENFLHRLFAGDIHHKSHTNHIVKYQSLYSDLCTIPHITPLEKTIIDLIIPADILIRYLLNDNESRFIAQHILKQVYDTHRIDPLLDICISSVDGASDIIEYALDFPNLKKNFFVWLQYYIKAKIQDVRSSDERSDLSEEFEDEIDEFLSYLDESDQLDLASLPGQVHVQTIALDKLINFYVSFVGGLWTARWDTAYCRIHKPKLLSSIVSEYSLFWSTQQTIALYARYFILYEKNTFYYQYVFNHVRSGKDSFVLPDKALIIDHKSNFFIIRLLHETIWSILLQDMYQSDVTLYIKNNDIIQLFKQYFSEDIAHYIKYTDEELIQRMYGSYAQIVDSKNISSYIMKKINDEDIIHIKDRMYALDFWLYKKMREQLEDNDLSVYDSPVLLYMYSMMKETLFGLLLYVHYIRHQEHVHQKKYHSQDLIVLYSRLVCGTKNNDFSPVWDIIDTMLDQYNDILSLWILLDDNQDYMYIGFNNRITRCDDYPDANKMNISDEDTIRFFSYLKHISYYNRRLLIPQWFDE